MPAPHFRNALPMQSMLQEYRIEQVLGAGGFGITYLGKEFQRVDRDGGARVSPDEYFQAKRLMMERKFAKPGS